MVESVQELRKICYVKRDDPRLKEFTMEIYSYYSYYILKLLLYTSITANQTSVIGAILGAIAGLFFLLPNPSWFIPAFILLHLWRIFDYCDGSIARYRKTTSGLGSFFDWLEARIPPHIVFPCIGLGLYFQTTNIIWIILGSIATAGWFFIYVFGHIKKILYMVKEMDEKLKRRIRKNKSKLVLNTISFLENILKNRKIDSSYKKDMYREVKNSIWQDVVFYSGPSYMPIIMSMGIITSIILGYNLMGVILLYYALVYSFLWLSGMILFKKGK